MIKNRRDCFFLRRKICSFYFVSNLVCNGDIRNRGLNKEKREGNGRGEFFESLNY